MRIHHPVRLVACAAIAGSAAFAVVVPGGTAFATTKPAKVVCTSLTGTESNETLSGCSDTAVTGGTGTETVSTSTIDWTGAGSLTSVTTVTNKTLSGKKDKCTAPAGDTNVVEVDVKGSVTGGTATTLVGGKVKGTLCVFNTSGGIIVQNYPRKSFDL
jgi:hypothetical protein